SVLHRRGRPSPYTIPTSQGYQPGKAPILVDSSPAGILNFLRSAKLFFRSKKIEEDEDKILYLGAGLAHFPELAGWYSSSAADHDAKTYDVFVRDLKKRALPRDYIWETEGRLRAARQGERDYDEWSNAMRAEHLSLTARIMTTREFIKTLLYSMDPELCSILRRGTSLKGSGFHEDDLADIALSKEPAATVYSREIDYEGFDREARDEWSKIALRRRSNAAQLRSLSKKTASLAITSTPSRSTGTTTPKSNPIVAKTANDPAPGLERRRPAKLTELERDWLGRNDGCFKCRRTNVGHTRETCTNGFAPVDWIVHVPAGWDRSQPVPNPLPQPPAAATPPAPRPIGIAAIHLDDDEIDLPESLAGDSDTDSDACAFPPLSLLLSSKSGRRLVCALADSGSSASLISDEVAGELGLEKFRLSRPKPYRLAIKGEEDDVSRITHFVRVRLRLANRSWSAGITTLLIAPLERPFDVILGTPFLKRHRASLVFDPEPAVLVKREPGQEPFDLLAPVHGPATRLEAMEGLDNEDRDLVLAGVITDLVERTQTEELEGEAMKEKSAKLMDEFDDLFPATLPPLSPESIASSTTTRHHIRLVDPSKVHNQRGFAIPRKWREAWKRMLDEHLAAGRLRPSTSPYASAAFVVPKKDPHADPRWVNDYRGINSNTVKDRTPLPLTDVVLGDAALARFWGKIDMTNAFFQTLVAEEDVAKTAIKTPWGLFEWTVMPQGLCNAPATHQARVNEALRHLIGVCCQAFVDDIIIYSKTLEEHERNCRAVLSSLRAAGLYCSRKKTDLFTTRTEFLGHIISRDGLEADPSKTEKIKNWARPRTVSQVRGFLGVVQYLRKFIPKLADQTAVLTPLTKKGLTNVEGMWTDKEERAFQEIKRIVTSLPVLRPVDQDGAPLWLMTDASKVGVGAVLLQGEDWKTASPCGFYSRQYIAAEKNYPTHEQELLAIIAALKVWRVDLLGVHFRILTDHDTLRHFQTQATLSKRQARWTETLADYDYELAYVPGKENAVADALSRFSFPVEAAVAVCGISTVSLSQETLTRITAGYAEDSFCSQILRNLKSSPSFSRRGGVLYFEDSRIVVPKIKELQEALLHDAHDALGHLGPRKTALALSASFYWPGLTRDVLRYVQSCDGCQRFKARTTRRTGELHPLPVPLKAFSDVALDFVGPLPVSEGYDMLLTMTDRLTGYSRLLPCRSKDGAKEIAERVFRGWYCLFGLPERLVSDRDKLFTSKFWRALHARVGLHLQMSTAFHPETDGRSERTNKTAIQVLRQYVTRQQKDWVSHLSTVEFSMNAAVNDSTGRSPFEIVLGFTPSLFPSSSTSPSSLPAVEAIVDDRKIKLNDARDALAAAKVRQAEQANKKRGEDPTFAVGDLVMVDSSDRRSRYKSRGGDSRAAKLFPRWDGPYPVAESFLDTSTYRLSLSPDDRAHPMFHSSKLKRYIPNDASLFPSRQPPRPGPIDVDGADEYEVEAIVDEKGKGRTRRFFVKWRGYPESENSWEPLANVEDTEALDVWEAQRRGGRSEEDLR
ncbi:hypothetical protein JCM5296_006825, partial [Sporobolomyces johnsonii]